MANIYDMNDTWNSVATTFTAIKMDVTDDASNAGSLLLDLKVNGVTQASINKFGGLTVTTADINGGTIDNAVIGGATPAAGTFTDLESDNIRLTVYSLTGTDIDPANGGIQYKTLATNTTFTESMASGESVILRISGGDTYTVTWPTMSWVTGSGDVEPTLTGSDVFVLWKESTTVYGAYVGSYV